MIDPRFALAPVAAFAAGLSLHRQDLRPVAAALTWLAAIDCIRWLGLPPRIDGALWCAWPGAQAALAAWAWQKQRAPAVPGLPGDGLVATRLRPSLLPREHVSSARGENFRATRPKIESEPTTARTVALAFLAYATIPLLPLRWSPLAWGVLLRAPHVAAVAVGLFAWAGRAPYTVAQRVALTLTWSMALDIAIGALSPGAAWMRAAPLAWATWGVVGVVLAAEATRRRAP